MRDYLVIIEGEANSYSGCAPDLPGCVAAGRSAEEVERLIQEGIAPHVESLKLAYVDHDYERAWGVGRSPVICPA